MTYIEALQAHLESVKQLEEANKVIALQAPKVEAYDDLMSKEMRFSHLQSFLNYSCVSFQFGQ